MSKSLVRRVDKMEQRFVASNESEELDRAVSAYRDLSGVQRRLLMNYLRNLSGTPSAAGRGPGLMEQLRRCDEGFVWDYEKGAYRAVEEGLSSSGRDRDKKLLLADEVADLLRALSWAI